MAQHRKALSLPEHPDLIPSTHMTAHKRLVILRSGNPTLASGFCGYYTQPVHTHRQRTQNNDLKFLIVCVVYTLDPCTQEAVPREFKATLAYIVSHRPARIHSEALTQNKYTILSTKDLNRTS